jgi:hypothetical protein
MTFLWCRPLRRLPRRPATNRNVSSGNGLPSLSLNHEWRHDTKCWGGVSRRQRDDWCYRGGNSSSDWVAVRRDGGGMRRKKWGKLSVRSNSRQWWEIRVVRYKWWEACRRSKPGWVTVQNRPIYLSRFNSAFISFFFLYGPRCCHPILLPTAACDNGYTLISSCIDQQS